MNGAIEPVPHLVEISSHRFARSRSLQSSANQLIAKLLDRSAPAKITPPPSSFHAARASSTAASSPHDALFALIVLSQLVASKTLRRFAPQGFYTKGRHNVLSLSRARPSCGGQTDTRTGEARGASAPDQRTAASRLLRRVGPRGFGRWSPVECAMVATHGDIT